MLGARKTLTSSADADRQVRPFIKWAGGKQAQASDLVARFPATFERYYEPFLGGGSVFFELAPVRATLADHNRWLIDTYAAIQAGWRRVAKVIDTYPNTRADFERLRGLVPESLDRNARAALFIYLNKTCFRGLYRVNRQGRFNVPYGAYERSLYSAEGLAAASVALAGVELRVGDFEVGLAGITTADFAYLDPPYYRAGGWSDFNRYTEVQFREDDHRRLAAMCRELSRGGIRFGLSQSDTPFVRKLFDGFRMDSIRARREINLDSRRRDIGELFISNYDAPA
jgi:DNA adenine methylase